MSNLDPTIQSSIITAVVMLATLVVTTLFNWLFIRSQRKADTEERFFYEVYPKRLAVYDDAIKELEVMSRKDREVLNPHLPREAVLKMIEDDLHTLDGLRARLELYGSPAARSIVNILRVDVGSQFGVIASESDNFFRECGAFLDIVKKARNAFLEFTREETGANLVDKKIDIFLKGVKGVSCKKQRKHLADKKAD